MSDEKYQNKYRIKTARANWHNYSGGAYFITVCTKNREHFLGEITVETGHAPSLQTQTMKLSPIGQFLTEKLQNVTDHCPYAEIPLFVVMPNHWHAVVFIDGDKTPYIRGNTVETGHAPSLQTSEQMQKIDSSKGWLSVAIGGIKSAVTKFAHDNDVDFAWQTRFHDRIIRNQDEMNLIGDYIENNPARWHTDCYNENNNVKNMHIAP
jgi:REP element-mobilizing transposase RayT